jgi:diketogulonate reductase-like aldo/keto reductase
VLSRPQVSSAIIGATRVAQLEENLTAIDLKLTAADFTGMEAAIAGNTSKNGSRPKAAAPSGKPAKVAAKGGTKKVARRT